MQSTEGRYHNEHIFYLVFEHMDLDLDQFIKDCPPPGMNEDIVRVSECVCVCVCVCVSERREVGGRGREGGRSLCPPPSPPAPTYVNL